MNDTFQIIPFKDVPDYKRVRFEGQWWTREVNRLNKCFRCLPNSTAVAKIEIPFDAFVGTTRFRLK